VIALDLLVPAVDRHHAGHEIGACGESFIDEPLRQALRRIHVRRRDEHHACAGHVRASTSGGAGPAYIASMRSGKCFSSTRRLTLNDGVTSPRSIVSSRSIGSTFLGVS